MKSRIRSLFFSLRYMFRLTYAVEKKLFFLNFLFFILTALFPVVSLWVLKRLIDLIVEVKDLADRSVLSWLGLFMAVQILQALVQQWATYFQQVQQNYLQRDISLRVMKKAGEIRFGYFENPAYFDALQITQSQSAYLPAQIMQAWQTLMQQAFLFAALGIFLAAIHWGIPLLLLLFSVPMALARLIFGRQQFALEKSIVPLQRKGYDLYGYTTLSAYAKESRLFGFGTYFMDLYRNLQDMVLEKRNGLHYLFLKRSIFLTFFEVVMVTLFTLFVIRGSLTGAITIGSMLVYFQAFQRLQGSISSMFRSLVSLYQHQLYLQEIMHFFSLEGRLPEPVPMPEASERERGILVRNLHFRYPGTDRPVLQDINMRFPGEGFVAIVGENGSGKSTLLKLICGLYAVEEGEILMEGKPVNGLPDEWFREKVSVLFQDFGHYYLTVAENVALGKSSPDSGRLRSSLELATAADFVDVLRDGQQSVLGRTHKNGEELSGGQWQKIAIARALYKRADILILDEPTSSMDPLSEHRFFEQLRAVSGGRLVLLVTHRLYNLRMADYIYVFDEGRVAEEGSFDELVQKDGLFNRYYKTQKL